jgi:dienelactone hydrolase
LTAAAAAAGRRSCSGLSSDGTWLYWLESRPEEAGRTVLVRAERDGLPEEVSPATVSLRSRVHEYGGGSYCLVPVGGTDPAIAYVDQADQRVWLHCPSSPAADPVALTPEPPVGQRWHHGDLRATADGRWVLAVRERHDGSGLIRDIVALAVAFPGPISVSVLCAGRDFFAAPRPDRTGQWLAWICWDHPDMPWDASELWVGDLVVGADGRLAMTGSRRVAGSRDGGGAGDGESVGQPLWCDDGSLVFASDADGWWQPWRWAPGQAIERLCAEEAEFHAPDWALGQSSMAELPGGALACRRRRDGVDAVGFLRRGSGVFEPVAQPCVSVGALCVHDGGMAWLGATSTAGTAPWWCPDPTTAAMGSAAVPAVAPPDGKAPIRPAPFVAPGEHLLGPGDISVAEHFSFVAPSGRTVHGLFYSPALGGVRGPDGVRPPLVVVCHGGPTGCAEAGFDPVVQLLTSRGFAVAAVDYAGSTGYGRAYRQGLWGAWGVADVDDCVDAARHLAAGGRTDPARTAIRGSSAGGFTALDALARSDVFAAAVSWYGVTDLLALAAATHDFESRYLDRLVGPLPEAVDEYRQRSPVHRAGDMTGAVLVLQGLDDPVVPPAQATDMVEALRRRGLRCEYLTFAGESHGFRRADTLRASLEAELAFYEEVLCPR